MNIDNNKVLNYTGLDYFLLKLKSFFIKNPSLKSAGKYLRCVDDSGNVEWAEFPSMLTYKGNKATFSQLPLSNNSPGDVWHVEDTSAEYVWMLNQAGTSYEWEYMGLIINLTNHAKFNDAALVGKVLVSKSDGAGGITYEWVNLPSSGDINVIETVKVNGTALTPDANKAVDITVPSSYTADETYIHTDVLNSQYQGKIKLLELASGDEYNIRIDNFPSTAIPHVKFVISLLNIAETITYEGSPVQTTYHGYIKKTYEIDVSTTPETETEIVSPIFPYSAKIYITDLSNPVLYILQNGVYSEINNLSSIITITKTSNAVTGIADAGDIKEELNHKQNKLFVTDSSALSIEDTEGRSVINVKYDGSTIDTNSLGLLKCKVIPNDATYSIKTEVSGTTITVSDFTADQSTADDITFVQGTNITLTPNAVTKKITIAATDTTYSDFGASGQDHASGLVPDPGTTAGNTKFLREDGTWEVPAGTYNLPAATTSTLGGIKVGDGLRIDTVSKLHLDTTITEATVVSNAITVNCDSTNYIKTSVVNGDTLTINIENITPKVGTAYAKDIIVRIDNSSASSSSYATIKVANTGVNGVLINMFDANLTNNTGISLYGGSTMELTFTFWNKNDITFNGGISV